VPFFIQKCPNHLRHHCPNQNGTTVRTESASLSNLLRFLQQQEVPILGGKVRMYWSACPKGCGIHGVADIGFEGCKAKDTEGNNVDGVHIYLGGKATKGATEARVLYKAIPLTEAKYKVTKLMKLYKDEKEDHESFEAYDSRVLSAKSSEEIVNILEAI